MYSNITSKIQVMVGQRLGYGWAIRGPAVALVFEAKGRGEVRRWASSGFGVRIFRGVSTPKTEELEAT